MLGRFVALSLSMNRKAKASKRAASELQTGWNPPITGQVSIRASHSVKATSKSVAVLTVRSTVIYYCVPIVPSDTAVRVWK